MPLRGPAPHASGQSARAAKRAQRERLTRLCCEAGLDEPDLLASELHLILEGARVSAQSVGPEDLGARVLRIGEAIIASHSRRWISSSEGSGQSACRSN